MRLFIKYKREYDGFWILLFSLYCLLMVCASCRHLVVQPQDSGDKFPSELFSIYAAAVRDASNPEPEEICLNLTAIVPNNPNLIWREFDNQLYVLTVTWVSNTSYYKGINSQGYYDMGKFLTWVTAVPELKIRCSQPDFNNGDLDLRLEQLLGLPPQSKKVAFVEIWVRPQDLFRPCPDNEISDTSCDLCLPDNVTTAHREWFNLLRAESYCQGDNASVTGYPWTQMGYTYDWGNTASEVGLSEFIIKRNSKVVINRIVNTHDYCIRDNVTKSID